MMNSGHVMSMGRLPRKWWGVCQWGVVGLAVVAGRQARAIDSPDAAPVTLVWDANAETDLAGYRVHYGLTSGAPTATVETGLQPTIRLEGLSPGTTYFVVVTAFNTSGLESLPSDEISFSALSVIPPLTLEPLSAPPAGDPALLAKAPTVGGWVSRPSGAFEFTITATPGRTLEIYASADMLNWELLGTTTNPSGRLRAVDPVSTEAVTRYYQVRPASGQ